MDSTDINKIAGGVIGALLVFLLLGFFSGKIYGTRDTGHHGEEPLAYALEIEEPSAGDSDEPELTIEAAIAMADPAEGKKEFRACAACHQLVEGKNGVGPYLWGVVGRDKAVAAGFSYSGALSGMDGSWGLTELSGFLENPGAYAPGTSMSYRGLKDVQDRANLIAYLNEADGTPMEFAAAPVETPAEAPAEAPAEQPAEAPAETETQTAAAPTETEAPAEQPAAEQPAEAPAETETETAAAPAETEAPAEQPAAEQPAAEAPTEETVVAAASGIDFSTGDAAAGEKLFRGCAACHKVEEGKNGVGPSLYGVVGRDIASIEGFRYSKALQEKEGAWTPANLSAFLESPKGWAKGTKMAYRGLSDEQDRIDIITYLNEADGSPEPLN